MSATPRSDPIQMYEDPEDWIVSYSTPFANYVYEPHPEVPNYWVAVRMKTAEEMRAGEAEEAAARAPKRVRKASEVEIDLQPTALYRLRNSAGQLLYVGISSKPPQRWGQHAADKEWWPEVADLSLEWLESRSAALDAESHAIRTEKPLHNVVHNKAT
jgi:predicted GIY-YIG superfamily endonuclease